MAENLKTTHYIDGSPIPSVKNNSEWNRLNHDAYCWFNNDAGEYKNSYGALYNFSSILTFGSWWTATEQTPAYMYPISIYNYDTGIMGLSYGSRNENGNSVRCLKD